MRQYDYTVYNSYKQEFACVTASNQNDAWAKALKIHGKYVEAIQFDNWYIKKTYVMKNNEITEISFEDFVYSRYIKTA